MHDAEADITNCFSHFLLSAQTNHGDQGLPSEGSQKGCQVCQDKEKS